jgi:parvulin-like peptidyl-prolyl isomerase
MPRQIAVVLVVSLTFAAACQEAPPAPAPAASSAPTPAPSPFPTPAAVAPPPTAKAEAPPEQVAAQHVLVAYKGAKNAPKGVTRSKDEAKKRAEEVAVKAKSGGDFTALVKEYSDDAATAERLGSVGKFKRDAMVKPFSDAAFGLKVDETSGPVESPFGFHVIKRNQ